MYIYIYIHTYMGAGVYMSGLASSMRGAKAAARTAIVAPFASA